MRVILYRTFSVIVNHFCYSEMQSHWRIFEQRCHIIWCDLFKKDCLDFCVETNAGGGRGKGLKLRDHLRGHCNKQR